ncbi:hypothetical protein BGZ81_001603 [Podila clonocystis]|nr:hypothetical protein BGZ81_001603 [Podila clonocystis]
MGKRPHDQSAELLFEERRQFIRDNLPSMELKAFAKRFFENTAFAALWRSLEETGFDAQANEVKTTEFKAWMIGPVREIKKADKISVANATKRHRTKLEVKGVVLGAHAIQQGMNRLVPEAESSAQAAATPEQTFSSADEFSNGGKSRPVSPIVAYLERRSGRAGQSTAWKVMDTDILKRFHEFRAANLGPFPLARDWIANLMYDSTFCQVLDPALLPAVRRAEPAPDIYERWATLRSVLDRVFVSDRYDDVASAVRLESMQDPIAAYLFVIIMA